MKRNEKVIDPEPWAHNWSRAIQIARYDWAAEILKENNITFSYAVKLILSRTGSAVVPEAIKAVEQVYDMVLTKDDL